MRKLIESTFVTLDGSPALGHQHVALISALQAERGLLGARERLHSGLRRLVQQQQARARPAGADLDPDCPRAVAHPEHDLSIALDLDLRAYLPATVDDLDCARP